MAAKLWMSRVVNKKQQEVMGEEIGELEMKELVPE